MPWPFGFSIVNSFSLSLDHKRNFTKRHMITFMKEDKMSSSTIKENIEK